MDRLRFQQQRRDPAAPAAQAIEAATAPRVDPAVPPGAKIEDLSSFERLRFESAGRKVSRPESRPLDAGAAPEINPASVPALNLEHLQAFERLRYRMSVPANQAPARQVLEAGTAPSSGPAAAPQLDLPTIYRTEVLRYSGTTRASNAPGAEALSRIATAPPPISGSGQAAATRNQTAGESLLTGSPTVPAPLPPPAANTSVAGKGTGGADPGDLAVVGLNPSPNRDLNVPRGRRPGSFSASPDGGGNGRIGMPGNENAASVPNLSVSPSGRSSLTSVPTVVPGEGSGVWKDSEKPAQTLMALNRLTGPTSVDRLSAADLERAAKTPLEPHERAPLEDRTVYTMAINMPNISSYQGSWIVRYAQLEEEKDEAPFSAPAPLRKVDPKYVAQAALEGIEGEVLLYAVITSVGGVEDAKVMRGIDERLDQSALEAIGKWQFTPAKRGGEPIAVEALFSIPFQLSKLKH